MPKRMPIIGDQKKKYYNKPSVYLTCCIKNRIMLEVGKVCNRIITATALLLSTPRHRRIRHLHTAERSKVTAKIAIRRKFVVQFVAIVNVHIVVLCRRRWRSTQACGMRAIAVRRRLATAQSAHALSCRQTIW